MKILKGLKETQMEDEMETGRIEEFVGTLGQGPKYLPISCWSLLQLPYTMTISGL